MQWIFALTVVFFTFSFVLNCDTNLKQIFLLTFSCWLFLLNSSGISLATGATGRDLVFDLISTSCTGTSLHIRLTRYGYFFEIWKSATECSSV